MGVYLGKNAVEVYGGGVKVKPEEEKTVTASTSTIEVTPTSGMALSKVTVNPTPSEEKTVTPSASQQIVSPSEGKLLSKVTVGKAVFPTGIAITTPPNVIEYSVGDTLDLSGMVVTGTFDNGVVVDITDDCTFSPANGATLTNDDTSVTISFTWGGKTYTTLQAIKLLKIVTWAAGTDEEIVAMVIAANEGKINLADYWAVGDEREVTLSAMDATGVGESHEEQTVTMVLMQQGLYELSDGNTCNFIVGQKNALKEKGYMHNTTSWTSWNSCARRTWCNEIYYNAIPSTLRAIFKPFKTITMDHYGSSLVTTVDYFALPAAKEVHGGSPSWASGTENNKLHNFSYYTTAANRKKKLGDSGDYCNYWERSPWTNTNSSERNYCYADSGGGHDMIVATSAIGLAPFGCI